MWHPYVVSKKKNVMNLSLNNESRSNCFHSSFGTVRLHVDQLCVSLTNLNTFFFSPEITNSYLIHQTVQNRNKHVECKNKCKKRLLSLTTENKRRSFQIQNENRLGKVSGDRYLFNCVIPKLLLIQ